MTSVCRGSGGDSYIRAIHAPLESGFWHCVGLAGQLFVLAVVRAPLGQLGDDGLTWSGKRDGC